MCSLLKNMFDLKQKQSYGFRESERKVEQTAGFLSNASCAALRAVCSDALRFNFFTFKVVIKYLCHLLINTCGIIKNY